jgi:leucyl aminopeptidase
MDVVTAAASPESFACDALVVGIFQDVGPADGPAARVDKALGGVLAAALAEERFEGKPAKTTVLHTHGKIPARRVIVVGLGPKGQATLETLRKAAAAAILRARDLHAAHVAFSPASLPPHPAELVTQARVEGIVLGHYRFSKYKKPDGGEVRTVTLLAGNQDQAKHLEDGLARGLLTAEATAFARDLVNEPPNHLFPERLAEIAHDVAREANLKYMVFDPAAMDALGMGAILAVGGGSANPPRLISLEYAPPRARKTVAIVGKGVCYDSGGINLKKEDLQWMKSDMAGGAAVIAAMGALTALRPNVRVLGIVAAVENMLSGRAAKPGDIVRAMNGKTIEINNTDAEGRVILADALAYAVQQDAAEIVDLATLTGSAMVALGYQAAAVMSNSPELTGRLLRAAESAGERVWQLPLYEEFLDDMRSPVADLRNSGSRYGGAQKGAIFLREFVDGRPWAHLDIAPTAFLERDEGTGPYLPKGATGFGVRTLLAYLSAVA